MKTPISINEMIKMIQQQQYGQFTGKIGYVYPDSDDAYYINSNLGGCECVECSNGYFYAELTAYKWQA